jgi:hypothetical protein
MNPTGLPATEQEQARFFATLQDGFALAAARTGELVRDFRVAGTSVRLRFAGEALTPAILPGLANPVEGIAEEPRCEICIWDSESSGVPPAPPPRPRIDFTGRGNIWGFHSPRYRTALHVGMGSVNAMDSEMRQAVFWVPSHQHLPAWVLASPLRSILHWWMELNGRQLVHAAVVGQGGSGVLIPGRGGSGKSSTALACLLAGLDFVSDDYVALALDPEPRAYRLYSTAKLDRRTLSLHPELAARCRTIDQQGFDKIVLFLEDGYRDRLQESLPLHLVLRPYISGAPQTIVEPVAAREVERALGAETLLYLPHVGARAVEFLDRVSDEVPHAAIRLGTDRSGIVAAIQSALETRGGMAAPRREARKQKPFVTLIVHFCEEDRSELRMLAEAIEAHGYPRTELLVLADGAARDMADEAAAIAGNLRFLTFPGPVGNAEAWNRGVRESFAELLVLIEPGDRLSEGALDALVNAAERNPSAAWIRGKVASSGQPSEFIGPLRGASIRKGALRECGLFSQDPFLQRREQREWIRRAEEKGFAGHFIDAVTLHAARPPLVQVCRRPEEVDLGFLKSQIDLRRRKRE